MKKIPAIITLIILLAAGGLTQKQLKKNYAEFGVFDYKYTAEGIANNYIDAVDLLYIMLNRPRFKADVNWINFMQNTDDIFEKTKENVRREFLLKTAFTDPYFTEAQLFGGTIYAAYSDKNIQTVAELLKLTNAIAPNSRHSVQLTSVFLLTSKKNITVEEIEKIENELLGSGSSPIQFYKLFRLFYKKRNMNAQLWRLYNLILARDDFPDDFKKSVIEEMKNMNRPE